jgi:radical SAM protein with 4Fe4S-binding SPASM domain
MSVTQSQDFFVQLHLTERCNLRCTHCYQSGTRSAELSLAEIENIAVEVSEMLDTWTDTYDIPFSPSFNITGGEPFLRQDIFEILKEVGNRGFELYLLSNGTLIDSTKAQILSELNVRGVQVSIEGPESIHERIRGGGSFASSLRGVRYLLDAGLAVTLNATLSDINADYFMDMVRLSSSLGVQKLGFSRLVPSGRGSGLLNNMLRKEKVRELYRSIGSLNPKGLQIVTGDPVASQMSDNGKDDSGSFPTGGCAAGISGFTVLPDGTVTPCRRLPIPIGNVRKDALREIWATSRVLESLREKRNYKGKCGDCHRWASCRGCRAIAYAYSRSKGENDFLAEDPQCFIDEEQWIGDRQTPR